jgi:hypothetical protein
MGLFLYFNLQQCGRLNEGQSNQGPEMAVLFTMGRRGVKRKKETKKSHVVGVVKVCLGYWRRNISNLPWLLWRVHLILITQIMSTDCTTTAFLAVGDRGPPVYLYPGDKLRSKPTSYSPRGVSLG